ncbi:MAG: glucosyl-3-phosphoglycerate synthase [Actinomycetota bacterium]
MDVREWFENRTFRHQDFGNIPKLISLKTEQNLTISVCLPTLNSGKTLDLILRILKEILIDEYPLIDELAIVDSRSSDNTVEIAQRRGVKVFFDDECLTDLPPGSGKGEALWKSLYFLKGDIIAWLDSDIKNIHPRFVYGSIGPLLTDKTIGYVKGFYQRPLRTEGLTRETGGGRVTELVARPLLNLFYPELSGLIQPLSGEYAGRRDVLESIPFLTGYGVEIGLLIDIAKKFGLNAIAQVNLEKRVHNNQSLKALGRMAFGVMQAAFQRLASDKKIKFNTNMNRTLKIIKQVDEEYQMGEREIRVIERPPMKGISEYRELRKQRKQ